MLGSSCLLGKGNRTLKVAPLWPCCLRSVSKAVNGYPPTNMEGWSGRGFTQGSTKTQAYFKGNPEHFSGSNVCQTGLDPSTCNPFGFLLEPTRNRGGSKHTAAGSLRSAAMRRFFAASKRGFSSLPVLDVGPFLGGSRLAIGWIHLSNF